MNKTDREKDRNAIGHQCHTETEQEREGVGSRRNERELPSLVVGTDGF